MADFDKGNILLDAGGGWTLLAEINMIGREDGVRFKGDVSGASLTHLKITEQVGQGDSDTDILVDSDFDTTTEKMPFVAPTTGASTIGTSFQVFVRKFGARIISLWAQGPGATVHVKGTVT